MENNKDLYYVNLIINGIKNNDPLDVEKSMDLFFEKETTLRLFFLKQKYNNFNLLEMAANFNNWEAFEKLYNLLAVKYDNIHFVVNDKETFIKNVLEKSPKKTIESMLKVLINNKDTFIFKNILTLPKKKREEILPFVLNVLKENNFNFQDKLLISRRYLTPIVSAILYSDWSDVEIEMLNSYIEEKLDLDKMKLDIGVIADNQEKIQYLFSKGLNLFNNFELDESDDSNPYACYKFNNYFEMLLFDDNLSYEVLVLSLNKKPNDLDINKIVGFNCIDVFQKYLVSGNFNYCLLMLEHGLDLSNTKNDHYNDCLINTLLNNSEADNENKLIEILIERLIEYPILLRHNTSYIDIDHPLLSIKKSKNINGEDLYQKLIQNKENEMDLLSFIEKRISCLIIDDSNYLDNAFNLLKLIKKENIVIDLLNKALDKTPHIDNNIKKVLITYKVEKEKHNLSKVMFDVTDVKHKKIKRL